MAVACVLVCRGQLRWSRGSQRFGRVCGDHRALAIILRGPCDCAARGGRSFLRIVYRHAAPNEPDKADQEACVPLLPPVDRAHTCARQQPNGVALTSIFPPTDRTCADLLASNPLQAYKSPRYASPRAICLGAGRLSSFWTFFH